MNPESSQPPIAIIGAGLMGSALAQVFLAAGHPVRIFDVSESARAGAAERVGRINVLLELGEDLSGLVVSDTLKAAVSGAELVIEAIVENLEVKRQLFAEILSFVNPSAILATNTSALPISDIAESLDDPSRVVGTHFWNPPWAIDLVEVVQGRDTSPAVVQRAMDMLAAAGMSPVHVKRDVPGFIGNRLQHALKREAIAIVESGICDAETVDHVVKKGFGSRLAFLGPLEQSDMLGLELTLRIHETLLQHLDQSPQPAELLKRKVDAGETGMDAGQGFRSWTQDGAAVVRQRFEAALLEQGKARLDNIKR